MKKNKIFEEISNSTSEAVKQKVREAFDISNRIYEILEKKGLSQRQFADLMEKKESEISKWLSGSHNFTLSTISNIQEKLGERIIDISRGEAYRQRLIARINEALHPDTNSIEPYNAGLRKLKATKAVSEGKKKWVCVTIYDSKDGVFASKERAGLCTIQQGKFAARTGKVAWVSAGYKHANKVVVQTRIGSPKVGLRKESNLTPIIVYENDI